MLRGIDGRRAPVGELLVDQLRTMARLYPDEVAYDDLDAQRTLTFGQWNGQSNQLARGLVGHGVQKGDRVAIYLPAEHILPWIVSYAAIHKAGAVAVPVNTRLTVRELQTILGHAQIAAAITCSTPGSGGGRDDRLTSLLDLLLEARVQLPSLSLTIDIDAKADADANANAGTNPASGDRVLGWVDAIDPGGNDFQVPLDAGDLADIMYTSGTTGLPKGVAVRHRNAALLPNGEVPWSNTYWIHGSPPFTFAGISFIYNPMKLGMGARFQARFDAATWIDYVEQYRPTACFFVPAMAQLLINEPRWDTADLSSLTLVSVGSAPLPPDTLVHLCKRFPEAVVTNGYGMTEAGPAYCAMSKDEVLKRIGSVGQPMPPMEVRIVTPDGDPEAQLAVGEHGEVLIRAKGREREYYKDPDATARTWTGDGWLHSGDIGYLDDDGFLYIVGRMKEVIIRGGNNVYATDVEAVLYEHPGVLEAAVVGIPHDVLGEDIAAFVVVKASASDTLVADDLVAFCRERLADYKCPRSITFLDELPRNATGKVLKRELVSAT